MYRLGIRRLESNVSHRFSPVSWLEASVRFVRLVRDPSASGIRPARQKEDDHKSSVLDTGRLLHNLSPPRLERTQHLNDATSLHCNAVPSRAVGLFAEAPINGSSYQAEEAWSVLQSPRLKQACIHYHSRLPFFDQVHPLGSTHLIASGPITYPGTCFGGTTRRTRKTYW